MSARTATELTPDTVPVGDMMATDHEETAPTAIKASSETEASSESDRGGTTITVGTAAMRH